MSVRWLTDISRRAEGHRSARPEQGAGGVGGREALAKGLLVTIRGDCLRGQASMWRCRGARLEGKAKMGESRGLGRCCEGAIAGRLKFCIFVRCLSNSTPTNPPTEGGCSPVTESALVRDQCPICMISWRLYGHPEEEWIVGLSNLIIINNRSNGHAKFQDCLS